MSNAFAIRRVGAGDGETLKDMNRLFGEVFDDRRSYASAPPTGAYLTRVLERDEFIALAAWVDGEMAGCLAAYELIKFEQQRSEIYIYDLAVRERFRRRGVATGLIEALKPIAWACGAWMILVQADPIDGPAVALYDKLGVREQVLHFDISPAGDPRPR